MSDKSKLLYYFSRTSENLLQESINTSHSTTTNADKVNINEAIVLSEIDDVSSPSSSSTTPTLHNQNEIYEKSTGENSSTTIASTNNTCELLNNIPINDSCKRDPGRGPIAAKEFLLLGSYQPNIKFPTTNHRHFCHTWYQRYKWLEFSEMTKKAYCFVCRFAFSEDQSEKGFTVDGFDNWSVGIAKFNKHQAASSHKYANDLWVNTVKNHRKNNDVAKQINKQHEKQTSDNRLYLKEIIRTIIFLARQGLAFRGHRENDASENKGNTSITQH
ncbi:unnamed protein product [Rotaria sp. Silwood2]|nr:unnamed protein product [Rotaria sp. Silwood2]CAF3163802.1 unnamed protein product [Rotaria sp. Silwood2]CAF3463586.1 unnamed protein product [Rotaria sp. Silwood2]CAF4089962.1 unnamed protein product [Rotaria sp. Silwood2]CAF4146750.1 unnamed protein product [Rotaria sp. Silwood2]